MNRPPLSAPILTPFTTKEIKPSGWMRRQLEIQANGLAGHLDTVWPDVADSKWIGGSRDAWERAPYWLDGFVPLAFLLEDEEMIARARRYIDAILAQQCEDGWICPCERQKRARYDTWVIALLSKVFLTWYDATGDKRIPDALYRSYKHFDRHVDCHLLIEWGNARWFEFLFALYRLYGWYKEDWILEFCDKIADIGVDWGRIFSHWRYDQPSFPPRPRWGLLFHVVNQAMALKWEALYSLRSGDDPTAFVRDALKRLMDAHGQPYGTFSGDECFAGRSPIQGAELCSIVDSMFSYETILAVTGETEWADRAEYLGFNALPATVSPDMWSHQYDQLANQSACRIIPDDKVHYTQNTGEANLFGLEPHFGCCTSNMGQGFPKLCLSAFMRTETGIASTILVPTVLKTEVNGVPVEIELETRYPFRSTLTYTVRTDAPVRFPFSIRIPGFVKSARVDGETVQIGEFAVLDREWSGSTTVSVEFDFDVAIMPGYDGMQSVRRGPLLFSLPLGEEWHRLEYERNGVLRKFPYCDYEVLPTTPFGYAFASDNFRAVERDTDWSCPFSPDGAPISLETEMAPIDWGEGENGLCLPSPRSRVPSGPARTMQLLPYGCTNLRMTVMPRVGKA